VSVNGLGDPLDSGIISDGGVEGIDQDHFVVLVGSILVDPVGVQHTEGTTVSSNTLFSDGLQVTGELHFVHSMVLGLSENDTSVALSLSSSSSNGNSVDHITLLGLVTEAVGLIGTSGSV